MLISTRTRTDDVRALASAIALGSGAGLVIGVAYLAGSAAKPSASPPVPTVSGPLQAALAPADRKAGLAGSPVMVATAVARRPELPGLGEASLRDRFRVAAEAIHAAAQPFHFQTVADTPSDLHCLTEAVYFEARGEAPAGQQAVAQVVLNRVRHPAFPKTICAVVHQHSASGCQFSFACSSRQAELNGVAWRRAETIASSEMHGAVMTAVGDATAFQAARTSPFAGLLKVAQVGAHIFYRFGGHAGAATMFHQTPTASIDPAKVELARLDPLAAVNAVQTVPAEGRVMVTLYPGQTNPGPAIVKSNAAPMNLASSGPAEAKSAPSSPARSVASSLATPPVRAADAPATKSADMSVTSAQS